MLYSHRANGQKRIISSIPNYWPHLLLSPLISNSSSVPSRWVRWTNSISTSSKHSQQSISTLTIAMFVSVRSWVGYYQSLKEWIYSQNRTTSSNSFVLMLTWHVTYSLYKSNCSIVRTQKRTTTRFKGILCQASYATLTLLLDVLALSRKRRINSRTSSIKMQKTNAWNRWRSRLRRWWTCRSKDQTSTLVGSDRWKASLSSVIWSTGSHHFILKTQLFALP